MEIREIFENRIKIESKVMSIESLFNNPERVGNTNYKPSYQRNYVWDDEKATYFIESILLGTEIPPLILWRNSDAREVIDGRQRYQTILRFIDSQFKLKKNGLQKLDNIGIANKSFKDIGIHLQDLFWDTKLRIIEFSFIAPEDIEEDVEDYVKKEIFRRYNSGITPLKVTEIDNAFYFEDDLNTFFKDKLTGDKIFNRNISSLLHFEKSNNEIILKKIRQLLVQHQIPIKYYAIKKDTVITKYYEVLFAKIQSTDIPEVYNSFIQKLNILSKVQALFPNKAAGYNRLISECLFWSLSILEVEGYSLKVIDENIILELTKYLSDNIDTFGMTRSSFSLELYSRYLVTSKFFSDRFEIDFSNYLLYNTEFKQKNKDLDPVNEERISFDELRINKPEPSSTAIMDIVRQMSRQRFLIRPPYQRKEVINKKKSSSIIESILLGIKLPPIFVFKRTNDVYEVLDGQQRLLSILGFIQESYLDENNKLRNSDKDGFALSLKNSILSNLNGKKFDQLTTEQKSKIKNFDLWIIEISQKNNMNFEPIDLFIRLNNKPYPIKEDTFEMWNSYISRDIIETIKSIHNNHKDWFYIRKNNSRMEDENIYTTLAYFQCSWHKLDKPADYFPKELDIYKVLNRINFRVKSKYEITRVLEDVQSKHEFIRAANELEFRFIHKLKTLLSNNEDSSSITLNKNLDEIFKIENGKRTQQGFYALWYFLYDIHEEVIESNKYDIRDGLKLLFVDMTNIESRKIFIQKVDAFKRQFREFLIDSADKRFTNFVALSDISTIMQGFNYTMTIRKQGYVYFRKGEFNAFNIIEDTLTLADSMEKISNREMFESRNKILLKRAFQARTRLSVAITDKRLVFGPDVIGVVINRAGFIPKFILGFLSSRYCYSKLFLAVRPNHNDDTRPLSVADIKSIDVPYVPLADQRLGELLVNYITVAGEVNPQMYMYFERLLDAFFYEICFKDQFAQAGITIAKHVGALQSLESISDNEKVHFVTSLYNSLSDPKNEINTHLLKILNVSEIQQLEEFS